MKYLLLFLPLFLIPDSLFASTDFLVSQTINYTFDSTGKSTVSHDFSLINKSSFSYASSYQLKLQGLVSAPANLKASDSRGPLKTSLQPAPLNGYQINVDFSRPVVGKNQSFEFTLSYNSDPAKHNGQIWEIIIPKNVNLEDFDSYNLRLTVPESFGKPAFLSPQPGTIQDNVYSFSKDQLADSTIIASFGQLQNYSFTLKYNLDNPGNTPSPATIALPPDTSYQRVIYTSIKPAPQNVTIDPDGNWLASYSLDPQSQLSITATGQARLFSQPNSLFLQSPTEPKGDKFWPADNPDFKDLASSLKTPKKIYNYVINYLTYDYSRLTPDSASTRRGALAAFTRPKESLCTDFTDLFITLARASGIPAREIQGFAYSSDPRLQNTFHSWPQYWNDNQKSWVSIDPTWGQTAGADYFSQFDFSHFAFVIHDRSSSTPLPPTDVNVQFSPYTDPIPPPLDISWIRPSQFFPAFPVRTTLIIKNTQPWAIYRLPVEFLSLSQNLPVLPPFASVTLPVTLQTPLIPGFQPRFYTASAGDRRVTYNIGAGYYLVWHTILGLTLALTIIAIGFAAYRAWSLHLQKLRRKNTLRW